MASLNMEGPYLLVPDKIDEVVFFTLDQATPTPKSNRLL